MTRRITHRLKRLMPSLLFLGIVSNLFASNPTFHGKPEPVIPPRANTQAPCEIVCPGDLTFTLASGECGIVVTYDVQTTGDCLPAVVTQTAGLPSGSTFPIGITQNCFSIDLPPLGLPDGDTTCCFNVTVNGFPNPTPFLACTDLAFVTLDDDCQLCIGAAAILEAGPYTCYDNYLVQLDKIPPYGNGPWTSPCVGAADIGKTYQVRITDPISGNRCWGNVKIEDKTPPVLECRNITLQCIDDPNVNPEPAPAITGLQKVGYTGLQDSIGEPSAPTPDILEYSMDYGYLPADAVVVDLNCRVKLTGHTRLPDLKIVVKAPDGTTADIFTQSDCAGAEWSVDVLFDDEGLADLLACDQLNANGDPIQCLDLGVSNPSALAVFDGKNVSGVWTVTISDNEALEDGIVEIVGLEISVNTPSKVPFDNCAPQISLSHTDSELAGDCQSGVFKTILRTWNAADASGNTSSCVQKISILQQTLADVVLPVSYDGVAAPGFNCTNNTYPSPEWIESQGLQGAPLAFGLPLGCNVTSSFDDIALPVCDGTFKIIRNWAVINWCTGEVIEHSQVIKVTDSQGPTFVCPANQSVTTNPFNCCATVDLPDAILTDDCSRIQSVNAVITLIDPTNGQQIGLENVAGSLTSFPGNDPSNPDTLGLFGTTTCLPKGTHIVTYLVEDNCGNTTSCAFNLTVNDFTAPVAACDQVTVVAIGLDDPTDCFGPAGPSNLPPALDECNFAGISWVKASVFDDGSYDACGNVKFTIRRAAPYSPCIATQNPLNGQAPCDDFTPDALSEFERAISESDSIKFYSCEVGTEQSVILRVYQLDANGVIAQNPNGTPIFNECNIQVDVQDKIKPVCIPPANVSVSCEQFDPSLSSYGAASLIDNCCLDTTYNYLGQCGLNQLVNYSNFDTLCNMGTILRQFQAFDCNGNTSLCTQQVVVNYEQNYFVRFPDDVIETNCNGAGTYGEPTFFGEDCELLAISYQDEIFTVVPDACYKIERTWTVINWCTFNPALQPTIIPNPNPNAVVNDPSNLPGPIVSACGTQAPWNATVVKIVPTDPAATDYCSFWSANANAYRYKQIIKIVDNESPEIANCPANPLVWTDTTVNDAELWHNVFNPSLPTQDLKEGIADLSITSSDDCSAANLPEETFLLFLDLDNDGTLETVVNSANLSGADTIRYNNVNTPGYLGGTPVTFDSRPVPTNQKWHFALSRSSTPTHSTASVRWNTAASPNTFVTPELPQGTHKIKWIVTDQCGNQSVCEHTFTVEQGSTSGLETLENDGFALFQNEPNPFSQNTRIGFRLPTSAEAKLSVFDAEGRLLFEKSDHFKAGYNAVELEGSQLRASSVLYYKLESGTQVAWRKMVLIR